MVDPTDLKDNSGRLRRLVASLVAGVAVGTGTYLIVDPAVAPDSEAPAMFVSRQMSAPTFVSWIALVAGVAVFAATLVVQNRIASKRWQHAQVPRARVID
jgi:hypothetical protein